MSMEGLLCIGYISRCKHRAKHDGEHGGPSWLLAFRVGSYGRLAGLICKGFPQVVGMRGEELQAATYVTLRNRTPSPKTKQTPAICKTLNSLISFMRNGKHTRLNNMPLRNTCRWDETSIETGNEEHGVEVVITRAEGEGARRAGACGVCAARLILGDPGGLCVSAGGRKWNRDMVVNMVVCYTFTQSMFMFNFSLKVV